MAVARGTALEGLQVLLEAEAIGHGRERVRARRLVFARGVATKGGVVRLQGTTHHHHALRSFEARLELGEVDGLGDILVGASVQAIDEAGSIIATGDQDEVGVPLGRVSVAYPLAELKPVHLWYLPVRDDEIGPIGLMEVPGLASVAGHLADVAEARNHVGHDLAGRRIVVGNDDPQGIGHRARRGGECRQHECSREQEEQDQGRCKEWWRGPRLRPRW